MVEIIGDLIDDLVFAGVLRRDDDLGVLLPQLLEHLVDAFVKEIVGIGALLRILFAVQDGPVVLAQDIRGGGAAARAHFRGKDLVEEAGMAPCVAGGAGLDDAGQQGIHVAVPEKGAYILEVAAGLPLDPEGFPASGIIGHFSRLNGQVVGLFVHVSDHEDLIGCLLLDHDRQKAVRAFFEILPGKSGFLLFPDKDPGSHEVFAQFFDRRPALFHEPVHAVAGDRCDLCAGKLPGQGVV